MVCGVVICPVLVAGLGGSMYVYVHVYIHAPRDVCSVGYMHDFVVTGVISTSFICALHLPLPYSSPCALDPFNVGHCLGHVHPDGMFGAHPHIKGLIPIEDPIVLHHSLCNVFQAFCLEVWAPLLMPLISCSGHCHLHGRVRSSAGVCSTPGLPAL